MRLIFKLVVGILVAFINPVRGDTKDAASSLSSSYILQTKKLPADLNFMPSLGNGHLGYTVYGDAIFMVGIYNGEGGRSKRARIPNFINFIAGICDKSGCLTDTHTDDINYEMNLRDGYFRSCRNYTRIGLTLEQRTYPHRYYTRALVYEVIARRRNTDDRISSSLFLKLQQRPGEKSDAFTFEFVNVDGDVANTTGKYRVLRGRTKIVEFQPFQNASREIFLISSENFQRELRIEWPETQQEIKYQIIVTADTMENVARKEMEAVQKLQPEELLKNHTNAWNNFWQKNFEIIVEGDLELSRIINAGIFYLASSMPAEETYQPNLPFYGLSPTGLARGNLESDYQGHNFWDTEIWMFPAVAQFSYKWARELLGYRLRLLSGAQYNARIKGNKGARFPWESAYTGTEVTHPCCPEIAQQEIHISPDIAFALQKYYAMTNDRNWLCNSAWPLVHDIAEFLSSRINCYETQKVCHLYNVMGPDEDHANVDDNVYTNVVSKIALEFAVFVGGICGNETHLKLRETWQNIAQQMVILYNARKNYHPQHKGYRQGTQVKQADTILLGYPLLYHMNSTTRLNDLKAYSNSARASGPAMTWSMYATNYLQTAEHWRAHDYFERGYKQYVRPEFKVWSETPIGYSGSANFLTGIGGFLQAIISGYGGIDFTRDGAKSVLIKNPTNLPPNVKRITIKYIRFANASCILKFDAAASHLNCSDFGQKFEITKDNERIKYDNEFSITLQPNESLKISTLE